MIDTYGKLMHEGTSLNFCPLVTVPLPAAYRFGEEDKSCSSPYELSMNSNRRRM
jgi:hypothetical protein